MGQCKVYCRAQTVWNSSGSAEPKQPELLNFAGKWVILHTKEKSEGGQMSALHTRTPPRRKWHPCHEVLWDRRMWGQAAPPTPLHTQLPAICKRESYWNWNCPKLFSPRSHLASSHKIIWCPSLQNKMIPGWMGCSACGVTQHCGM